jgi:hypothetical protein
MYPTQQNNKKKFAAINVIIYVINMRPFIFIDMGIVLIYKNTIKFTFMKSCSKQSMSAHFYQSSEYQLDIVHIIAIFPNLIREKQLLLNLHFPDFT